MCNLGTLTNKGTASVAIAISAPTVVGTITLASPLMVNSDVTIQGPGANILAISGNKAVRVFDVTDGAATTLNALVFNLTIKDGVAATGAGFNVGQNDNLQLTNCWLTGNTTTAQGGAINFIGDGDLTVLASTLSGNAANIGGAVYFAGTAAGVPKKVANCIWYYDNGLTVLLLARIGDPAPGGGEFASFGSIAFPDGPDSGPLFTATLARPAPAAIARISGLM